MDTCRQGWAPSESFNPCFLELQSGIMTFSQSSLKARENPSKKMESNPLFHWPHAPNSNGTDKSLSSEGNVSYLDLCLPQPLVAAVSILPHLLIFLLSRPGFLILQSKHRDSHQPAHPKPGQQGWTAGTPWTVTPLLGTIPALQSIPVPGLASPLNGMLNHNHLLGWVLGHQRLPQGSGQSSCSHTLCLPKPC